MLLLWAIAAIIVWKFISSATKGGNIEEKLFGDN